MSLGLVVLEKKLFTRTRTPTPQSDDIKIKLTGNSNLSTYWASLISHLLGNVNLTLSG